MKTAKMTFNLPSVVNGIAAIKMRYYANNQEWKVVFLTTGRKVDHSLTYFTDDRAEAIEVAMSIVEEMVIAAEETL